MLNFQKKSKSFQIIKVILQNIDLYINSQNKRQRRKTSSNFTIQYIYKQKKKTSTWILKYRQFKMSIRKVLAFPLKLVSHWTLTNYPCYSCLRSQLKNIYLLKILYHFNLSHGDVHILYADPCMMISNTEKQNKKKMGF